MPEQGARQNSYKRIIASFEPTLQHQGVIVSFIFFYSLLNIILFFVTAAPAWRAAQQEHLAYRLASSAARGGGATLNLNAVLIILVASRTLMTYLRQTVLNLYVPFDKAMPAFHSLVGNFLCLSTFVHGVAHIVRYSMKKQNVPGFLGSTSLAISGGLLTLILIAMRITSLVKLRKKSFETFYFVHHVGAVSFFILIIMHGSHKSTLKTFMYVTPPILIYLIDRFIRLKREKGAKVDVDRAGIDVTGTDMVCLSIPKIFSYYAGQYCDVKVPAISNVQWHPFTIASSPHESEMRFYIKVGGDWTRALFKYFKERQHTDDPIHVDVRGPYGAPAQHVGQYEHVVLISGGVGATPMASITKYAHHWILNYTDRGAAISNSVSAAFTRNQSVQGTPSIPGTPTRNASSINRSRNSRPISRNHSTNFSRNVSRDISRNFSRTASRNGSRPISRSGSGKLERLNSSRMAATAAGSVGTPIARSVSGNAERLYNHNTGRPLSGYMPRPESARIDRFNSGSSSIDRAGSGKTADSVAMIVNDQRAHQPFGPSINGRPRVPAPSAGVAEASLAASGMSANDDTIVIPEGMISPEQSVDAGNARTFTPAADETQALSEDEKNAMDEVDNEFTRPDDYDEELGNPSLPIPDRRVNHSSIGESPSLSQNKKSMFEILNDQDAEMVFDVDEEHVEEEESLNRDDMVMDSRFKFDEMDLEAADLDDDIEEDGVELENEILRDQTNASNAFNLLGMSFGPTAMARHMDVMDAKRLRSSVLRTSANLINDAIEGAAWYDRILFYLHTVTVNWFLLWIMMIRFTLAAIGIPTNLFSFNQKGLGVFDVLPMNIIDLVCAILVTIPICGAIIMEIYVNRLHQYLGDNIANSFDLFVMSPLLLVCIVLHILNLLGIGTNVDHVSKLTVLFIWPVLSIFIVWRISRTIGSLVTLAPTYRSSHAQTKSLDYIWVSKTADDDSWLMKELLPLADSTFVRLHRFITRHGPKTEPWMLDYEKVPLKTSYSRPRWEDIFGGLVERTKSGTVIGVFFCGPDSMAQGIQQAAIKAMSKSMDNAYARGYFTKKAGAANAAANGMPPGMPGSMGPNAAAMRAGGASVRSLDGMRGGMARIGSINGPHSTQKLGEEHDHSAYGCAVRFAIRIENFT